MQALLHAVGDRVLALDRHEQAEDDTGDRRVDARVEHAHPRGDGEHSEDDGVLEAPLNGDAEERDRHDGRDEPRQREAVAVEDRDDRDGDEVVDDREGEQERTQRRRQVRADDGEHRQRERDVGGRRDRPPLRAVATGIDGGVDESGDGDAAHGRDDGNRRSRGVLEIADDELVLELEADDEEEQCEQTVGRPVRDGHVEPEEVRADVRVAQHLIAVAPRRVRPRQRSHGSHEQQDATDGLRLEQFLDAPRLGPRAAGEHSLGHATCRRDGGLVRVGLEVLELRRLVTHRREGVLVAGHGRLLGGSAEQGHPVAREHFSGGRPDFPAHQLLRILGEFAPRPIRRPVRGTPLPPSNWPHHAMAGNSTPAGKCPPTCELPVIVSR